MRALTNLIADVFSPNYYLAITVYQKIHRYCLYGLQIYSKSTLLGMLELTCGRLDGSWITGTERKHFRIFFPFHASIIIGMGVIFLITNRVNKQIIPQTKV